MNEFPMWDIGTVNGIDVSYQVHWLDVDLAKLTVDGDDIVAFSSDTSGGFTSVDDVLEQAAEVVYQLEDEDWD